MTATRELNVVTKQIILNDKEKMSIQMIPVTADEADINEIQTHIDKLDGKYEVLVKDVARFLYLMEKPFTNYFDEIEYSKLKRKLMEVGKGE